MATGRAAYWTEVDDQFIETHWRQLTDRELADQLDRSEVAISSRRATLRLLRADKGGKPNGVRRWSREDDDRLRSLFEAGIGDEDIAIDLGRTIGAVAQRRSALRLLYQEAAESPRLWCDVEDIVLAWMFRRGWSDEKIGREMEKSACAIKDRRQTLGLWREPRQ